MDKKIYFKFKIGLKLETDGYEQDLSYETIRIRNFIISRKLWKKTAENCQVTEKCINSKLCSKCQESANISIPNFNSTNWRLELWIILTFHVTIFYTFREISRQRALWSFRFTHSQLSNFHCQNYEKFVYFFIK